MTRERTRSKPGYSAARYGRPYQCRSTKRYRVLIFRDGEGKLRAVENRCSHAGRRLDPNAEASQVQCCSLGKSHFDCEGHVVGGMAHKDLKIYPSEEQDGRLLVHV